MKPAPNYRGRDLADGWFGVPHYLFDLCETPQEIAFMVALLKCENRWGGEDEGWFHVGDERLAKLSRIGRPMVAKCRRKFTEMGAIESRAGASHRETEYRIVWGSAKLKSWRKDGER
jgi:hypothetical protein